jgi:putative transposase
MEKREHTPAFKAKVALEAIREDRMLSQIASDNQVSPSLVTRWRTFAIENLSQLFVRKSEAESVRKGYEAKIDELHRQIGQMHSELDWPKKNIRSEIPREARIGLIDGELSKARQCWLLGLNRTGIYYQNQPASWRKLEVMRKIDETCTEFPFYGARRIAGEIRNAGISANRKTVAKYMEEMGIRAIYPGPSLPGPEPGHKIHPCLLKGLAITHPDQVWGTDITYIRMRNGFMYLTAILDWFSRYVLSWQLSGTIEIGFVLDAAE